MGINTGDVIMGNLGASSRMNYTVVGDAVNLAARLYDIARGDEIIVSESTYDACGRPFPVEPREPVAVRGKTQPVKIYRILDDAR